MAFTEMVVSQDAMDAAVLIDRCVEKTMDELGIKRAVRAGSIEVLAMIVQRAIDRSMDRSEVRD